MASLHSIQEVLNDPSIKCKQAEDVRWLSHDMAIKAVIHTLSSILVSLDRETSENSDPTAHGLLNFMKSYKFVACTYLLSDILPHLSRLSCIFQKQHIDLSLVQPCLKTTIDSIKQYETTPGPNLRKLDEVLSSDLKDFDITPTDVQKTEFRSSIQVKYIQAVIVELIIFLMSIGLMLLVYLIHKRYPQIQKTLLSMVSSKLSVFKLPMEKEQVLVWTVLNVLVIGKVLKGFCQQVFTHEYEKNDQTTDASLRDMYPNLAKLASIAVLIPVSTAECERSFSAMNRIKTVLRNCLKHLTP